MNDYQKISKIILASLKRFNPEIIGLFGSYSRNENTKNSDIDILVRFKESISMFQLIRIENDLSEKLGIKVDLVTEGAIKNTRLKSRIEKDLQIIYKA
ncbi:MAG: nucleotidyltransferase family protein [Bacteroidales bacterium]